VTPSKLPPSPRAVYMSPMARAAFSVALLAGAAAFNVAPGAGRFQRRFSTKASAASPRLPPDAMYGDWDAAAGGSYVLEPVAGARCVVHFLGGAFVGAASQLTYRYLLEKLRANGCIVVASPYRLSFDYYSVCDEVERSLETALDEVIRPKYGDAICADVVCVGHSCGALLHTLSAVRGDSSFERSRLALISYNNKRSVDAIPLFDELVTPISQALRSDSEFARTTRDAFGVFRNFASAALDVLDDDASPLSKLVAGAPLGRELQDLARRDVGPLARQGLELADQLPDLLQEISDGAREFAPSPADVKDLLRCAAAAGLWRVESVARPTIETDVRKPASIPGPKKVGRRICRGPGAAHFEGPSSAPRRSFEEHLKVSPRRLFGPAAKLFSRPAASRPGLLRGSCGRRWTKGRRSAARRKRGPGPIRLPLRPESVPRWPGCGSPLCGPLGRGPLRRWSSSAHRRCCSEQVL